MARSAARWRSRPTTSKSTTAATSTSSIARTPACISCSSPGLPARSRNSEETMAKKSVLARLDRVVDDFSRRTRYFHEEMTKGRARMFAMQHRLNTRHRNSVLKLKVATNCPDWDTRIGIIRACSEEVIADHDLEFFELHEEADIQHSDAGWRSVERFAKQLHMEDAVVDACEKNLQVWELYLNGIGEAGDKLGTR